MMLWLFIILLIVTIGAVTLGQRMPKASCELESMSREEYDQIFWQVMHDQFGDLQSQASSMSLNEIKATPLERIQVIEELADEFGFVISEVDLDGEGTLQQLCDRTWSRTQRKLVFG